MRQQITNDVMQAGFPPLHLAPINFYALYQQRQQSAAQDKKTSQQNQPKTDSATPLNEPPLKTKITSDSLN